MDSKMFFLGILNPEDITALRYALYTLSPYPATSPVEAISTPVRASAPESLEKENWGTFRDKYHKSSLCVRFLSSVHKSRKILVTLMVAKASDIIKEVPSFQ